MSNMTELINTPITLGNLELKNRIIFAPTSMGLPEDEYEERLQRIAAGGCAMIVIGNENKIYDTRGCEGTVRVHGRD